MRRDNRNRKLLKGETQKKDGSYQYDFKDADGRRHFVRSWRLVPTDPVPPGKPFRKPLREIEKDIQADIKDGISAFQRFSMDQLFDQFIGMKDEVRETTRKKYQELYDRYIKETFGTREIRKIKYSDIKTFYVILKNEKKLSGGTIKKIHCIMSQCFDLAVNDDKLRKNPCNGVMKEMGKTGTMKPKKKTALTKTQQQELLQFVANSVFCFWLNLIVFLLGTGCRIGEAAGLQWNDVDFGRSVIHIRHSLNVTNKGYEHILQMPKTEAGLRDIPMLTEVRDALLDQKKRYPAAGMDAYVFRNKANTEIDRNRFNQVLKRIVKEYNGKNAEKGLYLPADLSAHTFRHSFGTRMCENGVNAKVTQVLMGHAKVSTTLDIYTDTFGDTIRSSVEALEGQMSLGKPDSQEEC